MASASHRGSGFTLVELMVTLAVIVILSMLALPSFSSFLRRSAVRGATEQAMSFWNQARFEAAKRNQMVKVGVYTSGSNFCLGAATTTNSADSTPCNCLDVSPSTNVCDVATFPAPDASLGTQSEWRKVTFVTVSGTTPTLGGTDQKVAVIEPKRGALAVSSQAGVLTFAGPAASKTYRVNLWIDSFGKALLCESNSATDKMADYNNRTCAP
jgi:prepilin-type N-terminal cleavage/methylation domain-containing protein